MEVGIGDGRKAIKNLSGQGFSFQPRQLLRFTDLRTPGEKTKYENYVNFIHKPSSELDAQ